MNRLWIIAIGLTVTGANIGFSPLALAEEAPISVIAQTPQTQTDHDRAQQEWQVAIKVNLLIILAYRSFLAMIF